MTKREVRQEKQFRRLGTRTPQCKLCRESNPAALIGRTQDIICYECEAKKSGKSEIEQHHPAGQNNDSSTVPIPANDHRGLSDRQSDWPLNTLRNPEASPLLKAAAAMRGWLDILAELIERILGWIPEFLEALDDFLLEKLGSHWWEQMLDENSK
jgi:hypothetical protein